MTSEGVSGRLDIDLSELAGLLREALQSPALQLLSWEAQAVHGGAEGGSAVYRLRGQAEAQGGAVPWSLILKVVEPRPESSDPQGFQYYKREALAYRSGLLQRLPGKIRGPRCYGVQERADGSVWLWLEDVQDEVGEAWPLAQYGEVAWQLGRWNGAYLVGEPLPSEPWVTRGWLRRYVEPAAPMVDFLRGNPDHPIVKSSFGGDVAPILAFWDERERYFDALDRLPQVYCHQDATRRNLFARHDGTVAIDWGYAGVAAVGTELAALVVGSLGLFEVPASQVAELDRVCFEGYIRGLREAGWDGDAGLARLGYLVTIPLRYAIASQVGLVLPALLDEKGRAFLEGIMGRPAEELERVDPALAVYMAGLDAEARELLS